MLLWDTFGSKTLLAAWQECETMIVEKEMGGKRNANALTLENFYETLRMQKEGIRSLPHIADFNRSKFTTKYRYALVECLVSNVNKQMFGEGERQLLLLFSVCERMHKLDKNLFLQEAVRYMELMMHQKSKTFYGQVISEQFRDSMMFRHSHHFKDYMNGGKCMWDAIEQDCIMGSRTNSASSSSSPGTLSASASASASASVSVSVSDVEKRKRTVSEDGVNMLSTEGLGSGTALVSVPIFYEPYNGEGSDELVIRVLHEETFYETLVKKCNYVSHVMPFHEIMPYLQKKITCDLTMLEVHVAAGEGKETLECVMDLKFYRVKDNPISEKQTLLFQRYKTATERDYENEIKRQKVVSEQVRSENAAARLELSEQREANTELEKRLHALECGRLELEQRVNECEARNRGLSTMNEELRRFRDKILGVVYSNEKVDAGGVEKMCPREECPPLFDDTSSIRSFNADSHSAMFGRQ